MKKYFGLLVLLSLFWAISSCSVKRIVKNETTYADTHKAPEHIKVSYKWPVIKINDKTPGTQSKGGIVITVEILPFIIEKKIKSERKITYCDPEMPGYDIYEVTNTPYFDATPEKIQFKVSVKNNEFLPLKLSDVCYAVILNREHWSFISGNLEKLNEGPILSGFEKEFIIDGPDIHLLSDSRFVYLFLNGVPTSVDNVGNITQKDNFEWYFDCSFVKMESNEQINYSYEPTPVYTEKCPKCNGTGLDPETIECERCGGKGSFVNRFDGKTYKCPECNGTGIVHDVCKTCNGTGVKSYPKSQMPPATNIITWSGWVVKVNTIPSGATIKSMNSKTGQYDIQSCTTPCKIDWFCTDSISCPIIVEYNGQSVQVLPYTADGKELSSITIDFSSGKPIVKKGQKTN